MLRILIITLRKGRKIKRKGSLVGIACSVGNQRDKKGISFYTLFIISAGPRVVGEIRKGELVLVMWT